MKQLFTILLLSMVCTMGVAQPEREKPIKNPMLWADVPDPDVIRVGDTFYLVSTTMHLMPGAPVMASKDLKNWETVGYIFDKLTDSPKYDLSFSLPLDQQKGEGVGTVYGRGQWATSLKYHDGKFWALLAPNEQGAMGDTYIFTVPKAEGPWTIHSRLRHFHETVPRRGKEIELAAPPRRVRRSVAEVDEALADQYLYFRVGGAQRHAGLVVGIHV